ncbi:MAG: hypothetical protein VYC11_01075 [Candidatus Thermoplasmatota archaeon]|jgi:Holliday junction resolvase|nr:hypothetical protein [Euryarchaeota archaeon]MEC9089942.1 hypothetical protein [Candidatus Thermoplasmatota archaeon]MED5486339.1 hypothetical protein [Candidatus Thermoplasmatota archaeon]|tara:strand:+ start:940 stop:1665 length:726 start_codon:yes stop_codon:yes gene_type:complete
MIRKFGFLLEMILIRRTLANSVITADGPDAPMASNYERELRAVLAGSPAGVRAVTRSCTEIERAYAMQVVQRPFLVVRAAGSGMDGSGDLLALRGDICFPIEVKTRSDKKVYLSGQKEDQLNAMQEIGEKCGLMPLYAHRLKGVRGDSWRIFRVDTTNLSGRLSTLARRIPKLPLTRNGKPHLDWDKGLPLHKFLALVCRNSETGNLSKLVESAISIEPQTEKVVEIEPDIIPTWMERFRA